MHLKGSIFNISLSFIPLKDHRMQHHSVLLDRGPYKCAKKVEKHDYLNKSYPRVFKTITLLLL